MKSLTHEQFFWWLYVLAVTLRYFFDSKGYGVLGSLVMILAFSLFIPLASKTHKKSFIFSVFILIILIYSYINVCFTFHYYIYPLKPLFRYLTYLMVLSISYIYLEKNKVFRLFSILVFIEILLALYQILAFGIDRPPGTLQNNNTLMYLIVLLFSLNIAWKNNFILCFILACISAVLGGLGGCISIIISLVFYIIYFADSRYKKQILIALPFVLIIGTFFLRERFFELSDIVELNYRLENNQYGGGSSLVWRIVMWRNHILHSLVNYKVLSGFGLDYASLVSPYSTPVSVTDPHNDYLLIFIDFGLPILAMYIIGVLFFLSYLIKITKRYHNKLSAGLATALVGILAGQLVGNILTQTTLWWIYFGLLGCMLKEVNYVKKGIRISYPS